MLAFYRALLHLYPAAYRCEFGGEMMDVLQEVQAEKRKKGALALLFSGAHETGGLVFGAVRERFYKLTGSYDSGIFSLRRRFAMKSEFRFPKSTVGLMVVILAAVLFTIEKAKAVSASIPHANPPVGHIEPSQITVLPSLLITMLSAVVIGVIGWGILYALRRTGVQQLSEMNPAANQRGGE
ncbi:MAG TPA: hypothetical protein VI431_18230 [Candidatus Acidoferrum sp.]